MDEFAAREPAVVEGYILNDDGSPMAGAEVVLDSVGYSYSTLTDASGFYSFMNPL